ncbi:cysteine and tyrosine-rich protein 1-like [Ylistrum balloti]|uniref:cysteine and tyrosine-rich protein 1-like n=1 Tax=Ylistrum balloti TaxID=509963 RepID=UPI002905851A|nr:cysteine and tyrosine-rich protein 1-like [Ylistrum balloti]
MKSSSCPMEIFLAVFVQFLTVVYCNNTEVCTNLHDEFTCEYGCCGDYRKERCCSFAGTIVGIVVGVALFIGFVAGLIYCYIKKRGRTGPIFPCGPNRSAATQGAQNRRQPGRVTVIQTTHCYNAGRGRRGIHTSVAGYEGFVPYSDSNVPTVKPPLPPAYEPALPPPPPYSAVSGRTSTGISTVENYSPAHTTPPVS